MTVLPIVERELRVAARRPVTYRLRFGAALAVIALGFFVILIAPARVPAHQVAKNLFIFEGSLAFGFCLLAGVFLTADCLSAEKREGTLGLLFLTDLRGFDVVLGKLFASSVQSFYALLAILPMLGLPLLMGGVTAGEFWRLNFALLTTLVFSLIAGMLASSLARESRHAMVLALGIIVVLAGLLPALRELDRLILAGAATDAWVVPSPTGALLAAFDSTYRSSRGWVYWAAIQTLWGLSLAGLVAACLALQRTWRQSAETAPPKRSRSRSNRSCAGRVPMGGNPFLWLLARGRSASRPAWVAVCVMGLVWLCFYLGSIVAPNRTVKVPSFIIAMLVAYATHLILKTLVAMESTRRLSEDRSSGALELLLVTRLSPAAILEGQRSALWLQFRIPMVMVLLMNLGLALLAISSEALSMNARDKAIFLTLFVGGALLLGIDFHALTWAGMRAALRATRHSKAVWATMLQVMGPGWLGIAAMVMIGVSGRGMRENTVQTLFTSWILFGLVVGIGVAVRARGTLYHHFRALASGAPHTVRGSPTPLVHRTSESFGTA